MMRQKTWVNDLTHTLTHNGIDSSGQGSTKQHLPAAKLKETRNFQNFSKIDWVNPLCPHVGIPETKLAAHGSNTLVAIMGGLCVQRV